MECSFHPLVDLEFDAKYLDEFEDDLDGLKKIPGMNIGDASMTVTTFLIIMGIGRLDTDNVLCALVGEDLCTPTECRSGLYTSPGADEVDLIPGFGNNVGGRSYC